MISLLAAAAALSPKLVSLHDFALGCRCRLVSPSLSPCLISLLVAAAAAALSPKLVSLALFSKSFPALRSSQLESTDHLCKAEGSQPKAKS